MSPWEDGQRKDLMKAVKGRRGRGGEGVYFINKKIIDKGGVKGVVKTPAFLVGW